MSVNMDSVMGKVNEYVSKSSGDVPIHNIFTRDFVMKTTNFFTIKQMMSKAGIVDKVSFDAWDIDSRNAFAAMNTNFSTWTDFENAAAKVYVINKLTGRDVNAPAPDPEDPLYDITIEVNIRIG